MVQVSMKMDLVDVEGNVSFEDGKCSFALDSAKL